MVCSARAICYCLASEFETNFHRLFPVNKDKGIWCRVPNVIFISLFSFVPLSRNTLQGEIPHGICAVRATTFGPIFNVFDDNSICSFRFIPFFFSSLYLYRCFFCKWLRPINFRRWETTSLLRRSWTIAYEMNIFMEWIKLCISKLNYHWKFMADENDFRFVINNCHRLCYSWTRHESKRKKNNTVENIPFQINFNLHEYWTLNI